MTEECGLGVRPYVMSTAGAVGDMEWLPEDARASVRDYLADPVGTNADSLTEFMSKIGGEGEPDQPAIRQKHAWPARDVEELPPREDRQRGKEGIFPLNNLSNGLPPKPSRQ